jgi:ornithine cyclodeaminase
MEPLRILSAREVREALPMAEAIAAMREAFAMLARGTADIPPRTPVASPEHQAVTLVMPGRVPVRFGLGAKVVSVFPGNAAAGRPVVQGVVVLLDDETGAPAAVLDGTALTAIRTGAASGLATDLLAPPEARSAAIIGAGMQARTQLEAVCTVRRIEDVRVWSRTPERAARLADEMRGQGQVPATVIVVPTAAGAVDGADVICTATSATTPVLFAADVRGGSHLNAIGSFTPEMQEFDPALLREAFVVVDQRAAAREEAGEVIAAVQGGVCRWTDVVELGELLVGARRRGAGEGRVSVFKSVGLAVQDLAAGARLVARVWRSGSAGRKF